MTSAAYLTGPTPAIRNAWASSAPQPQGTQAMNQTYPEANNFNSLRNVNALDLAARQTDAPASPAIASISSSIAMSLIGSTARLSQILTRLRGATPCNEVGSSQLHQDTLIDMLGGADKSAATISGLLDELEQFV